jgi:aryl-alcohol dehydrogenase-like predicted oxidoreductase
MKLALLVLVLAVVGIAISQINYALSGPHRRDEVIARQRRRNMGAIVGSPGSSGVAQHRGPLQGSAATSEDDVYR